MAHIAASQVYGRKASKGINWVTVIAMTTYHVGAVAAFFYIDWGAIAAAALLWYISGSLGHRHGLSPPAHAPRLQDAQVDRVLPHHLRRAGARGRARSSGWPPTASIISTRIKDGDPHTPREGTYWAHMGWIMTGQAMHHDTQILKRYAPDLSKDKFHVAMTTWHWVPQVVVGLALLAFGGLPYVLWGVFFRTTFGLHATWLVNSATHLWGSRRFVHPRRFDATTGGWRCSAGAKGWHNNHHAHPVSARHGLAWYELDMNYLGIRALESVGLAWDVKVAKLSQELEEEAA